MTHCGDRLSALLDGEIGGAEHDEVVSHLRTCASCRDELDHVAAARASVRSLPILEMPAALLDDPGRETPAVRLRPVLVWSGAGAAALALALALGLILGPGSRTVPIDLDTLAERHTARVVVQPGVQTVRAVWEGP